MKKILFLLFCISVMPLCGYSQFKEKKPAKTTTVKKTKDVDNDTVTTPAPVKKEKVQKENKPAKTSVKKEVKSDSTATPAPVKKEKVQKEKKLKKSKNQEELPSDSVLLNEPDEPADKPSKK